MIVITKDTINNIYIYRYLLDNIKEEYRFTFYKSINEINKTGNFITVIDTNCEYVIFTLEEVPLINQDLPNGLISLQDNTGFWHFTIETKDILDTDWVIAYEDLSYIKIE